MKDKLQSWLHDLGVALGLIEPPLQPVPISTDEELRRRQQRRR
ncbi:PA1414 family protein [Pseudomonas protegens]